MMKFPPRITDISVLMIVLLFSACVPDSAPMTLSEFNGALRDKATGSFAIEGKVRSYGVELRGSSLRNIKTKDGRKLHYLRLQGADGKRAVVWLDSKRISLPKGGDFVRVTGRFEKIDVLSAPIPIFGKTIGFADGIRKISK